MSYKATSTKAKPTSLNPKHVFTNSQRLMVFTELWFQNDRNSIAIQNDHNSEKGKKRVNKKFWNHWSSQFMCEDQRPARFLCQYY